MNSSSRRNCHHEPCSSFVEMYIEVKEAVASIVSTPIKLMTPPTTIMCNLVRKNRRSAELLRVRVLANLPRNLARMLGQSRPDKTSSLPLMLRTRALLPRARKRASILTRADKVGSMPPPSLPSNAGASVCAQVPPKRIHTANELSTRSLSAPACPACNSQDAPSALVCAAYQGRRTAA